ncbi:MAG: element excision factor XisI family protein [Bacteroidota bacterium]
MDKKDQYQRKLKEIMQVLYQELRTEKDDRRNLILDDATGQYLLLSNHWKADVRYYGIVIHLELKPDGKIWLQYDGTDLIVGQYLLDAGIPKSDIVLGFHAPIRRIDTGFAVA